MRFFHSSIFACALAIVSGAAHAETQPLGANGADAPFKRLHEFLAKRSLEFRTSFDRHGKAYGVETGSARFQIERPNLFRIEIDAGRDRYELVSDGKDMTIYNRRENKYAVMPAPATPFRGL